MRIYEANRDGRVRLIMWQGIRVPDKDYPNLPPPIMAQ